MMSPAGLSEQIQLAQQHGIDAFAINTDAWDTDRQTRADNLFQAAETLNFKLFFSIDLNYNTKLSLSDVTTILNRYAGRSSRLLLNGKRFLSTFQGRYTKLAPYSDPISTWNGIFSATGGRDSFYFVPYMDNIATTETDVKANVDNIIESWGSLLDGLFAWDTSGWPMSMAITTTLPMPQTRSTPPPAPMRVIALQPAFVEIISWKDWVERHYVVTVPSGTTPPGAAENHATGFPHLAFLDVAGRYYIPWFKTGQQSSIQQDVLYLYYYTQTKSASELPHVDVLEDRLYATVLLTQGGDVALTSGTQTATFPGLGAGINSEVAADVGHCVTLDAKVVADMRRGKLGIMFLLCLATFFPPLRATFPKQDIILPHVQTGGLVKDALKVPLQPRNALSNSDQLFLEYPRGVEGALDASSSAADEEMIDMEHHEATTDAIPEVEISEHGINGEEFVFLHYIEKAFSLRMDECFSLLTMQVEFPLDIAPYLPEEQLLPLGDTVFETISIANIEVGDFDVPEYEF
ncbi:hypothetical protein L7F22_056210 [Adiantum nelumboides]|nr:hypothetical protein [Adiantum nelumboides]